MLLVRLGFSHYRQSIDSNGFNFLLHTAVDLITLYLS